MAGVADRLRDAALGRRAAARLALHGGRALHGAAAAALREHVLRRLGRDRRRDPAPAARDLARALRAPRGVPPVRGPVQRRRRIRPRSRLRGGAVPSHRPPCARCPDRPRWLAAAAAVLLAASFFVPTDAERPARRRCDRPCLRAVARAPVPPRQRGRPRRLVERRLHGHGVLVRPERAGGQAPGTTR